MVYFTRKNDAAQKWDRCILKWDHFKFSRKCTENSATKARRVTCPPCECFSITHTHVRPVKKRSSRRMRNKHAVILHCIQACRETSLQSAQWLRARELSCRRQSPRFLSSRSLVESPRVSPPASSAQPASSAAIRPKGYVE